MQWKDKIRQKGGKKRDRSHVSSKQKWFSFTFMNFPSGKYFLSIFNYFSKLVLLVFLSISIFFWIDFTVSIIQQRDLMKLDTKVTIQTGVKIQTHLLMAILTKLSNSRLSGRHVVDLGSHLSKEFELSGYRGWLLVLHTQRNHQWRFFIMISRVAEICG